MKDNELHILFEKLRLGDKNALEIMYNKYEKLVYSIAFCIIKNKESAEDIKQNVFIKIFKLDDEKLPTSYESSWIYQVTKNETINYIRKNKENINIEDIYHISYEDKDLDGIIDKDFYNKIIKKLNTKEQEIISLKILGDRNFREISEMLRIPIGTVKWKYYKAINTLKPLIANLCLFIISLAITLKNNFSLKNKIKTQESLQYAVKDENLIKEDKEKEILENNNNIKQEVLEDKVVHDTQEIAEELVVKNETKANNRENSIANKTESINTNNKSIQNENVILEESVINRKEEINNLQINNNIRNILIGSTSLFFIITIILIICFKHSQLKLKKKLSK